MGAPPTASGDPEDGLEGYRHPWDRSCWQTAVSICPNGHDTGPGTSWCQDRQVPPGLSAAQPEAFTHHKVGHERPRVTVHGISAHTQQGLAASGPVSEVPLAPDGGDILQHVGCTLPQPHPRCTAAQLGHQVRASKDFHALAQEPARVT